MINFYLKIISMALIVNILGLGVVKLIQVNKKVNNGDIVRIHLDKNVVILKSNDSNIKRGPYIVGKGRVIPIPNQWEGGYYRKPYRPDGSSKNVK